MSKYVIDRPVWRRFHPRWFKRAAAHVRAGGHAVILDGRGMLVLLLGTDQKGKITELGLWSLLSIEQRRWRRVKEGPARGLATARVKPSYAGAVFDWCDRDSIHPGAVRRITLDCLECGACCHDAQVVLDEDDLDRFRHAGREDLTSRTYIKRSDGRILLRLADDGRCQHLGDDLRCAVYPIRPDNCRVFVVGSEACLAAREETLGIRDGAVD